MPKSEAHLVLEQHLRELGLQFESEYKFCPTRRWRADYYIRVGGWRRSAHGILIEIEGGIWSNGRHTRGSGFACDLEKYRMQAILGYIPLRFSTQEVRNGTAKAFLREHICQ